MTPELAADLAARTKAAIDMYEVEAAEVAEPEWERCATDRERVDSDLEGLMDHREMRCCYDAAEPHCSDALRYAAGLVRTGALYGVNLADLTPEADRG